MKNGIQYLEGKFPQQKNVELAPIKQAYSYIRFSTDHQSEGDSLRRQLEGTKLYCQRKGLALNESLNLRDLGVSAFHGRNAESGSLGRFLQAVKDGQIAPGSALVVEGLDRLSRQNPWATVSLLKELKDYGIEIHLTMADMVLSPNEQDDGMKLMYAVAMASRAHDESKTKSKRLLEAFAAKRKAADEGKVIVHKSMPWWLTIENGKIIAVPERAAVVKRIFELTAGGTSSSGIARLLNREKVPTWRPKTKIWLSCRVRGLIKGTAALGTMTPTDKAKKMGRKYALVGYYPILISEELAAEARAAMLANRSGVGRVAKGIRPINIFRGLLYHRGQWLRFQTNQNGLPDPKTKVKGYNGYYELVHPDTDDKSTFSLSVKQFDPVIVHALRELRPEDLLPPKETKNLAKTSTLRTHIAELQRRRENLLKAVESGSTSVTQRLVEVESQVFKKQAELAEEDRRIASLTNVNPSSLKELSFDLSCNKARQRTADALRRIVSRIDVGFTSTDLPLDEKTKAAFLERMFNADEPWPLISDPIPNNKRRKELFILITFVSGAQRTIARLEFHRQRNVLVTCKVERQEDQAPKPDSSVKAKQKAKRERLIPT
jgi:DNA invertase Pin-like site-specific DNA recombinase